MNSLFYHLKWLVVILFFCTSCQKNEPIKTEQSPPTSDLQLAHLFNGDTTDSGPNQVEAEVAGAEFTANRYNIDERAFYFDGDGDYIEIQDHPNINLGNEDLWTVSVWVKPELEQNDVDGTNNDILTKWDNGAQGYPFAFRVWNQTAPIVEQQDTFFFGRYDGVNCNFSPLLTDNESYTNEWYHLAMVRTITDEIIIYKNATEIGRFNDDPVCDTDPELNIFLGARKANYRQFTGAIDDLLIYSKELTPEEIQILYNL